MGNPPRLSSERKHRCRPRQGFYWSRARVTRLWDLWVCVAREGGGDEIIYLYYIYYFIYIYRPGIHPKNGIWKTWMAYERIQLTNSMIFVSVWKWVYQQVTAILMRKILINQWSLGYPIFIQKSGESLPWGPLGDPKDPKDHPGRWGRATSPVLWTTSLGLETHESYKKEQTLPWTKNIFS